MLLVDDDQKYRRLVGSIIADSGFEVSQAGDAEEALAALADKRFTLMLTDLQMPGLDGLELAALAQRLDPDMEIVLVSAAVSTEVQARACRLAVPMVDKPGRVDEVLAVIASLR
ncbi:response regulator [Geomonas oryzisoli]|uniref:Response regulator n=1 Tax=Geomonas oryzisoli TaxID=2847992 RepID=A0ABX8J7V4_9BACT|nr:response regulator [Geomonas oryzisoli]QWV92787.1 response regulator [Geomonas oryzisoli]